MPDRTPASRPRFHEFQDLMRYRIMDVLLVATPYDAFVLEEAGELSERMLGEFRNLDLHYAPGLTSVATGGQALELARTQRRFNLILTTPHLADMNAVELARRVREQGRDVPVVLLARNARELADFTARHDLGGLERVFMWQGDARILVAIVKSVEDRRNAEHDNRSVGVQVILLVEDRVRQYSSFLPAMYTELLHHSQRVVTEGLNLSQKILRMRARPKILLCTNYEEAEATFDAYAEDVLGIVADVEFPRAGELSATAGADFARHARQRYPDIPIILHSSQPENEALARRLEANFLLKGSPLLLENLSRVMLEDFGFGDFVFRMPDGAEVGRASDLKGLEEQLASAPEESIRFHATRNHFSRWLKARTVFTVSHALRPRRPEDYPNTEAIRDDLVRSISDYREEQTQAIVADFDRSTFDNASDFYRIGGGSLGGKARGLAFVRRLLAERSLRRRFPDVEIAVPAAAVLGTDVFDRFLAENDLRHFAIECEDDEELRRRFAAATFPEEAERDISAYLERARVPIAVRSSSLLEDSQYQPFTGVYDTLMLANNSWSIAERVSRTLAAIRQVYASTFTQAAKAYLKATTYRLEEEKMAVILQRIVGSERNGRFYPTISGVARSHNFYPSGPMVAEDGIAAVALGLGRTIVEGGVCLRFCPRYPQHLPQLASGREALKTTQRGFWALPLARDGDAMREEFYALDEAETDGSLAPLASTYSRENDALSDGLARPGTRVVTFAPILRYGHPPLADLLATLLEDGAHGMGSPVEVEFALDLPAAGSRRATFGFLQMRPLAVASGGEALELGEFEDEAVVCRSQSVLGNGRVDDIRDLVVVDPARFERSRSREVAAAVGRFNAQLIDEQVPYLLIGVGRWGSRDPWLGIPVAWDQVSGARVIVEAGLRDAAVTPSQGSHFFQNLTSFNVGYFTIDDAESGGHVDWKWFEALPARAVAAGVRHLRLERSVVVRMDGRKGRGVILKPGAEEPLDTQ
jgi:CheY-like chemotaxis protein